MSGTFENSGEDASHQAESAPNEPCDASHRAAHVAAESVPAYGRLLGLDYGTRRIGIAISTDEQTIASPLENYTRQKPELDAARLMAIATDYEVVGIVVGLPVHMSGDEGGKAREARVFGGWVREATGLPVCFWDERFTSAQADEIMRAAAVSQKKRKEFRDKLAAQVLLQSFLDSRDRSQAPQAIDD